MPITLTEDEMNALVDHLHLESRFSFYRDELQEASVPPFNGDENDKNDYALAVKEAEDLFLDADEARQSSGYFPADAFAWTPHFGNLCTQAEIWTIEHGAILPRTMLQSLVSTYLQENT